MFDNINISHIIITYLIFIISGTIHEFFHSFAAYRLGDHTVKTQGRLTLNPKPFIDIFGSVIFPLVFLLTTGGFIGWMRTYYNPRLLKNPARDSLVVSLAGIFANFMLMISFMLILLIFGESLKNHELILTIVKIFIYMNAILFVLNIMPFPPFDGGEILKYILIKKNINAPFLFQFGWIFVIIIVAFGVISTLTDYLLLIINIDTTGLGLILAAQIGIVLLFINKGMDFLNNKKTNESKSTIPLSSSTNFSVSNEKIVIPQEIEEKIYYIDDKLSSDEKLNDEDLNNLEKIKNYINPDANICPEEEFELSDKICKNCEYKSNCLIRKAKLNNKL